MERLTKTVLQALSSWSPKSSTVRSVHMSAATATTHAHDTTRGAKREATPAENEASDACQMVPGLPSSLPKSTKSGHSSMNTKFMPGAARWLKLCNLLSLNGADAVSAEMAFTIVHCLCLDNDMDVAAAVYLCIMWGCQCGRQDVRLKSDLMHHMGYNGTPKSGDMSLFGEAQLGVLKRLDFNVRAFGLTAIEVAQQKPGTLRDATVKWCLALTYFQPGASAARRAAIAAAEGGMDMYINDPFFTRVATRAGKLLAMYVRRSKEEERWCAERIASILTPPCK